MNSTTNPAYGRQLSDLWLNGEEGKLHPAEWQLLECVARGELCDLGDDRPDFLTSSKSIRAEIIRFLALGGDAQNPVHELGLQLWGAFIICPNGALDFEGCVVDANCSFTNCAIDGAVVLRDAITRGLDFNGCSVDVLSAERCTIRGELNLRNGFATSKTVWLKAAKIEGTLDCSNARFGGAGISLNCENIEVAGPLRINNGFVALGAVRLVGAKIASHLLATDATFSEKGLAINLSGAKIGGNANFGEDCRVAGQLSFQGAKIGGDATFAGGSFEGQPCINLRNAAIDGMLVWRSVKHARGELNLAGASCRTLNMDETSWNKPTKIRLDNFTYRGFSELPKGCDANFWKRWLERQPDNHLTDKFRPKPYSQLADVLVDMGHEQESVAIRVERRRRQAQFTRLYEPVSNNDTGRIMRKLVVFWNFVQGALVDYGFRPGKAVLYLAAIIVIGTGVYQWAAWNGIMTPTHPLIFKEVGKSISEKCARNWVFPGRLAKTKAEAERLERECAAQVPSEYSTFNALIYSADVALPIVNFRMEADWSPRVVDWTTGEADRRGWWVRTWEWVQIALGWLLSLLFASAIGGIIRR